MTDTELDSALLELDRLLNDPEVSMDPDRVWSILAEVSPQLAAEALVSGSPATGA